MVNYPAQVGELENQDVDLPESITGGLFNPFPGLRPFTINESHLYFGREGQVDEILLKLSRHRSVTVIGHSGSGKSSLMHCGLVPVLYGGFMTHTSPHWHIIPVRPGRSPLTNLTQAIVNFQIENHWIEEADRKIQHAIISSVLRSGPDGLVEVAKYLQTVKKENVLFLIDQFEELFRYSDTEGEEFTNDAKTYVSLVLYAVHQQKVPVYITINLRSDFLGDCSAFTGLTQMINTSNYLVPQMTREQKRMAIEGPVAVGGGKISERLVKKLLADINDQQDQLPILQHAMMRAWDYWSANREPGEPIDIRHYNAIGQIAQALSLHANEAYDELTIREREIAEVLFKNITEKGEESQGMRRPCQVRVVAEIAEATDEEVIKVVDQFRQAGRSFLMPDAAVHITADSVIELSHESIMRIWNRLAAWVDEESESARTYKRISEAAAMYQIGKTGLWRPPDLQLALNWQKKQKPTRTWAQRYDIAFERAIVFLDTSRITYEAELKNQELLQRRLLRRARATNVILAIFLLVAIAFFFFGLTQQIAAEREAANAREQEKLAVAARDEAEQQRITAEEQTRLAKDRLEQVERLNTRLSEAVRIATLAQQEAEKNYKEALYQKQVAETERGRAEAALNEANRLLYLSVAQSMEAKSVGIDDPELAGLLSMQGYLFHTKFEGKRYDPYVFSGLYYALAKLTGANYNAVFVPGNIKNRMYALAISKENPTFFTTGNDGRIFKGNLMELTIGNSLGANPFPNRVLALSPDEKYLAVGSDSSFLQVYDMPGGEKPRIITGHKSFVHDIKFLPDGGGLISSAADRTLRYADPASGQSKLLLTLPFSLKAIALDGTGKRLAGISVSGQLVMVDLQNNTYEVVYQEAPNRLLSVAWHPTRNLIAIGVEVMDEKGMTMRGTVKLFDASTRKITKELSGHKSGISDIAFSPDGLLLASAGLDRKLQMWVVDQEEDLPILMDNNNGNIWDIAFAKGSDYLLASCNNGEVRVWPTNTRMLAEQVCPKLSRNMTPEEWEVYVANGIAYESTCKSLLIDDL